MELYCNHCGSIFTIENLKQNRQRFCSRECNILFLQKSQRLKRKQNITKATDRIPIVFNIEEPTDRDKLVPLDLVYITPERRCAITTSMRAEGIKATKIRRTTKRVDGINRTYDTNAFTLGQLYDAIQLKHSKYKQAANYAHKRARDNLVEAYKNLKDK